MMKKQDREVYSDCPIRGNLKMNKYFFWQFFYHHRGPLKHPVTKPRLTKEHIQNRLKFTKKWIEKLNNEVIYACFLDEKWFYTTSQQRK